MIVLFYITFYAMYNGASLKIFQHAVETLGS